MLTQQITAVVAGAYEVHTARLAALEAFERETATLVPNCCVCRELGTRKGNWESCPCSTPTD